MVTGGPGSGKSIVAMSLLGELYRRGTPALHATGPQSFTKTMRKVAGNRKLEVQQLFKYFNSFMDAEPNDIDVLICVEAHRLRKTSANRYTKAELRTGRPQVADLIDAARVPVFPFNQHQVVTPWRNGHQGSDPAGRRRTRPGVHDRRAGWPVPMRRQRRVREVGHRPARPGWRHAPPMATRRQVEPVHHFPGRNLRPSRSLLEHTAPGALPDAESQQVTGVRTGGGRFRVHVWSTAPRGCSLRSSTAGVVISAVLAQDAQPA